MEDNSTLNANSFWNTTWPLNLALFQTIVIPPERPNEGIYSKQSKCVEQKL
jgi:hypothetical protein